jgi:acyl carrier protein
MDILKTTISCIANQTICDSKDVTEDAKLKEDLLLDSFDIACLALNLEDEFDIEVNSNDLQQMNTVREVINYVSQKLGELK